MSKGKGEKSELVVVYEKRKDALTFPVSGAFGGPTADGHGIAVNLYLESMAVPHSIIMHPDADGKVDPNKGDTTTRGDFVREIQATIHLTPEGAITLGNWLTLKGKEGMMIRKAREESEDDQSD